MDFINEEPAAAAAAAEDDSAQKSMETPPDCSVEILVKTTINPKESFLVDSHFLSGRLYLWYTNRIAAGDVDAVWTINPALGGVHLFGNPSFSHRCCIFPSKAGLIVQAALKSHANLLLGWADSSPPPFRQIDGQP